MSRLVALISGRGSNLQAVLEAIRTGRLAAEPVAVISNRPDAPGLAHARQAGCPTFVIDHRHYRADFDSALRVRIDESRPDLIILAGFMRVLGTALVEHYRGRMLNIHPSLLPAYRGLDTHARALAADEREHGASVHFVTPELDGGPVIARVRVPVLPDDDPERLAARVLAQEHRLYPRVISWYCDSRLALRDDRVLFDGRPLSAPLDMTTSEPS